MTQAFPIQWPHGQTRSKKRVNSNFKVNPAQAYDEMIGELARFKASHVVVSTNIPLRRDGSPYRDGLSESLEDPGVAVYFRRGKQLVSLCCDTYRRPWENMRAVGKSVEAFRAMERYGAHQILNQAFTGFAALPPPDDAEKPWHVVLGCSQTATRSEIMDAWKAKVRHAPEDERLPFNVARDHGLASVPGEGQ